MSKKIARKENKREIESQLTTVETKLNNGIFVFTGPMTIGEFSHAIKKPATLIIGFFLKKGKMFNINQTLDEEQIAELALEYGFDFQKKVEITAQNFMSLIKINDDPKDLKSRPPIVTIMGHVDHGKTTLIDKIRNSHIAASEAGGITQHTGAYQVIYQSKPITFLDTPGHEAFTAMRARGAQLTDIVILVVAADDGVMPQTREAVDHAKAAKVPMVVFVNKMDKPGADYKKVIGDLSKIDVVVEEWGGNVQMVKGSGLTGMGLADLFEAILLQAELLELKANPNRLPIGVVVESRVDKGLGPIATIIVQHGTLYARDFVVAGSMYGKIRTLTNTENKKIDAAGPGTPAIITGLTYSPNAGDKFFGSADEKFAKKLAAEKEFADKQSELKARSSMHTEDGTKIVNLIIKADVQGTTEAVKHALAKLENKDAKINVVRASVGQLIESDVLLAQASNATVYTFNLKISPEIRDLAQARKVIIKTHNIIYKMIEEVEQMLTGLKVPVFEEKLIGTAQVIKTFFYSKVGLIIGAMVLEGKIKVEALAKIYRNDKLIYEGKIETLQRGPDHTKSVEKGKEFGCHIKNATDVKEFDIIKVYEIVEVK